MITLRCQFEILTPLFLGGAGEDQRAELRPPSIKGLLRFWYRALDPRFAQAEAGQAPRELRFFGGTSAGAGQSPFLLRLGAGSLRAEPWDGRRAEQFREGGGTKTRNGLVYLGFPFQMRKERTGFVPGQRFELSCVFPKEPSPELRRAVLGALWCLGHLGGAGSRSRRGFGSLALREWSLSQGAWDEIGRLPLLHRSATPAAWNEGLNQALDVLGEWFKLFGEGAEAPPHPHLGAAFYTVLLPEGFSAAQWDRALNHAGRKLQDFRQRRAPDYQAVKDHVIAQGDRGRGGQGRPLDTTPQRAVFGLPLAFRYSSLPGSRPAMLVPFDMKEGEALERHGSLLFLRLVPLGDRLHPLFVRMAGALPGVDPPAALRGARRPLRPAQGQLLDEFMQSLGRRS